MAPWGATAAMRRDSLRFSVRSGLPGEQRAKLFCESPRSNISQEMAMSALTSSSAVSQSPIGSSQLGEKAKRGMSVPDTSPTHPSWHPTFSHAARDYFETGQETREGLENVDKTKR